MCKIIRRKERLAFTQKGNKDGSSSSKKVGYFSEWTSRKRMDIKGKDERRNPKGNGSLEDYMHCCFSTLYLLSRTQQKVFML